MRRITLFAAALAIAACSSPDERARCATTADCGPGEVCARTDEGAVCWPDDVDPVVSEVTLTCLTPTASGACPRDGLVRVTARVTDDQEVGTVTVVPSLAPGTAVPLEGSGDAWAAELALADLPFPRFEGELGATVHAKDAAGNEVSADAPGPVEVTRLRWTYDAGRPLSPAAVTEDGTIVVARADSANQAVAVGADGTVAWRVGVGTADVTAAPMVGGGAIWFASTDGTLYPVSADGSKLTACATGAPLNTSAALVDASLGRVVAGNAATSLRIADASGTCNHNVSGGAVGAPPVTGADGTIFAVTASALRRFEVDEGGALSPLWGAAPTVGSATATPGVDSEGSIWTVSIAGAVHRTDSAGASSPVATVGVASDGIVVLADGSAVLGDDSERLRRLGAGDVVPPWNATEPLTGTPSAPLALEGAVPTLVTGTTAGWVYAVRASDGAILWSHQLGTMALRIGNVFQQDGDALPTAYFPSAGGKLHAIVVDGGLDASAPWPKPFHDARNTGNAATPLP